MTTEKLYPYTGLEQTCNKTSDQKFYLNDFRWLWLTEDQIADSVAEKGPVAFSREIDQFQTFSVMKWPKYAQLMINATNVYDPMKFECVEAISYHAITIVGFGETDRGVPYWLVKNSWGKSFADGGYFKLRRGKNVCEMAQWVYGVTVKKN